MDLLKEKWNEFTILNGGGFLQSWEWGNFQESLGNKIFRINIEDKIQAQIILKKLPFKKSWLYCARGPVFSLLLKNDEERQKNQEALLIKIEEIAKKENAIFLKLESEKNINNVSSFKFPASNALRSNVGWQVSRNVQPQKTLILSLMPQEEEILNQMHPKTRYNIRLAQKKGIEMKLIENPTEKDFEELWQLLKKTSSRDKFKIYPKDYYEKMLKDFELAKMVGAFYEGKMISAKILVFFGSSVVYLHGASDYDLRPLMAPYLSQWFSINLAKSQGFKFYDFWGIEEKKWPGITRFKKGFGGQVIEYPLAQDFVFQDWWYKLYNLSRKII